MERPEEYEELITELEDFEKSFISMAKDVREANQRLSYSFFKYSDVCRKAAEELKRMRPVEAEIEGGGSTWWYVCEECRMVIDRNDHFCRHCGRRIKNG